MYEDSAKLIFASNGWVMGDDPLRNFAEPGKTYFQVQRPLLTQSLRDKSLDISSLSMRSWFKNHFSKKLTLMLHICLYYTYPTFLSC